MYKIDTTYLNRCVLTLEKALSELIKSNTEDLNYDLYRSACVKEFEIILEQAGKLLKKCLKPYLSSTREADNLYFKDIFRNATKYGILNPEETKRWLEYRDNRNLTAHDYGEGFAEETLTLLPQFIKDSKSLIISIDKQNDNLQ
jgi:nucleotidyltransferase substrate binding protein (TIGR01987 family)